jgi:hypothetical protein
MGILSSKIGCWSLASLLLIIIVLYMIIILLHYCKNYYSLPASFGSNDNHIQSLRLHISIGLYILHNMAGLVGKNNLYSSECRVPGTAFRVSF